MRLYRSRIMHKTAEPSYTPQVRKNHFYSSLSVSNKTCPFKQLIDAWLAYCRVDGISPQTIYDYSDKISRFYWWWTVHTKYSGSIGVHPSQVGVKEAREFASYLREPAETRWGG